MSDRDGDDPEPGGDSSRDDPDVELNPDSDSDSDSDSGVDETPERGAESGRDGGAGSSEAPETPASRTDDSSPEESTADESLLDKRDEDEPWNTDSSADETPSIPGRDDEAAEPVGDPRDDEVDDPGQIAPEARPDSGTGYGDREEQGIDRRDDSTQLASEERRRKTVAVSAVTAAVGLWVALSVVLLEAATASVWNNVLVGLLVLLAAGYNVYRLSNDVPLSVGVSTLVALLGIWLIVAAAALEMLGGLFWTTLASGLLIAGLAGYNAYEAREAQAVTQPTQ